MITTDEAAAIANGELTLSSVLLGKALDAVKAKTAALWATMLGNPVTTIVAVIGVATAAWVAYQAAHEKSLKSLKESLDETKDRISSVTDKIKDNTTRIEELQKLKTNGTISAAEEAELETLTKQTEQYEAQLKFLQEIEKHKTKEYNNKRLEEAREAYNEYTSYGEYGKDVETWNVTRTTKGLGGMQNAVEDYNTALAELAKTQEKVRNFTPDDTEQSAKEAERLEKQLDRDQAKVDAHFDALERHYLELIALREKFDGLDSDEARSMVSFIDGWMQQIADITHVNTPLINDFKHALNDSDLDKTWADFFNRLAASKTDIDLARLIEPEFSANSGLQEWADKYGYTVDDIISHVQKLREEINKPAEDAGKAAAKTNKELISFGNRLKSLRADIVKTLGQGKELTQEQTEEFYNWISAFDYLDGETKDIQQRAQEFLSMLAQYFSIKPEWEINDNYIKNMLRDAEEQYDSLREKIETGLFGNIDLNNRQELHWDNDEIINQYKEALLSWGQDLEEIKGSVSTVLGASSEFDGVEIAFSPILQTDSGAKLLSQGTVYDYVNAVLKEAAARNPNGDGWTTELAFEVDKEGLDIAGQHIQGLFADIGDTAMQSGELMHHVSMSIKGDSDALTDAFDIAAESKYRAHESALAYIRNFVVNDIADLASLQDELKNTGKAWQEYQNLVSGGDTGDTAKQMASAYQKAIEDLENGRFDTKAVWGAAKLLFSDEQLRDMEYDLVEIAKRLRSPMMQALFGKAGDGEDDYEIGVKFANYIRESIGILGDSAGIIDNGDGTFKFWYDSLGKLSKQLGMSEEAVSSLLEALSAYGVESMRSTEDNDALAEKFERIRSMAASADEAVREFARGLLSGGITENHVMDILENLSDAGVIDLDTSKLSDAVSWAVEDLKKLENEENTPKPDIDLSNLNAKKDEITAFKTFLDETLGNLKPYTISVQFDDETKDRLDRLARAGGFSTGTRNAPGGIALVNEKGPELISDGGEAYIANGGRPGFTNLSRGAVVFNAEETKQIFRRGYTNVPIKAFADGTSNTVDKASLRDRLLGGKRVGGLFTGGVSKVFECGNCHHRWNYSPIDYPNGPTGFCPKCGARIINGITYGGNTVDAGHANDDYYQYSVSTGQAIDNYDETYENYYSDVFANYKTCPNCGSRIQERYDVCPGCGYNFHIGKVPWRSTRANIRAAQSLPGSGAGRISGSGNNGYASGNNGYGGGNNGYGSDSVGAADYINQADPQKTDWVAVLINRIQRGVASLEKIASSGFKSLGTRTDAATKEISEVYHQIAAQEQGYNRYMQEANSLGLSSDIVSKIVNGTIDITEYDEETSELIDKFSSWYEKAIQCKEAVADLRQEVADLNQTIFNNTQKDFENQLDLIEHSITMQSKQIEAEKAVGNIDNAQYYDALTGLETQKIKKLQEELAVLKIRFQEAMDSGEIEMYSEAWYSMVFAIQSVEEAIADAHIRMLGYQNAIKEIADEMQNIADEMRNIEWDYFDYAHEQFGRLQKEANFLIDIMSNDKLFEDNGTFAAKGEAVLGLRVLNYNAYMAQAEAYKKEIEDKFSGELTEKEMIDRRNELLDLQQQSIQAAESEKDAIRDLVSRGIQLEIASLKDLISEYETSLDRAKSLHDYQKKINTQTGDIAKLQKQLSAYSGDNSEENRARMQRLNEQIRKAREDLEETEWEQNIAEQKKLLDELSIEFEDYMNARLDDIEQLVNEVTDEVNNNLESINIEIHNSADQVGYTLSNGMSEIMKDGTFAYYDRMFDGITSVIDYLAEIYNFVQGVSGFGREGFGRDDNSRTSSSSFTELFDDSFSYGSSGSHGVEIITDEYGNEIHIEWSNDRTDGRSNGTNAGNYDSGSYGFSGQRVGTHNVMLNVPESEAIATLRQYGYGNFLDRYGGLTGGSNPILIDGILDNIKQWHPEIYARLFREYATGGLADYTGLAMLHGSKQRPELVLNADDTERFLEAAKLMRTPVLSALTDRNFKELDFGGLGGSGGSGVTVENLSVDFVVNNPESYEDILAEARNDHRFERLVDSIVFSKIRGKSSFGEKNRIYF